MQCNHHRTSGYAWSRMFLAPLSQIFSDCKKNLSDPDRFPGLTCTSAHSMTLSWEFKGIWEGYTAVTLRASRSCQTTLPASRSAALSYEHTTTHSCFSCFECSAMQKINSSGYSTSTQANLNTTSIHFLQSLLPPPPLSPGHIIKMTFPVRLLPVKKSIYTFTSAAVNQLYFICRRALEPLQLFTS